MGSPGSIIIHVPRVPELGIPKDASDIPVKVELLRMDVPEAYVESIAKILIEYMRAKLMSLSLDEGMPPLLVGIMPTPRVVGPVMEYKPIPVLGSGMPIANALSRSKRPVENGRGKVARGEGKLNDPVPSITRSLPDS